MANAAAQKHAGGDLENELNNQLRQMQSRQPPTNINTGNDFDNAGEDLIMMNIPREGNADQLNKSIKLTLSSKKQYENHL